MKDNELLVQAVKAQKALARRNLAAKYWVLLALILLGALVWFIWYYVSPVPFKTGKFRAAICLFVCFAIYLILFALCRKLLIPKEAACPQCGYGWEIKEGRYVPSAEVMTNWDRCPGCGILMTEVLLRKHLNAARDSHTKETPIL